MNTYNKSKKSSSRLSIEWNKNNKERRSIIQRNYYKKHKLILKKKRVQREIKFPEKTTIQRRKQRLRIYGLTLSDFDELLNKQGKKCSICKEFFSQEKRPEVDHSHSTGKVRSLLCHKCNLGVGVAESKFLEKAIKYLSSYK